MSETGTASADPDAVREAFRVQAYWCERLGSPFTARLCTLLPDLLRPDTAFGRRVWRWPGRPGPEGDSVPLRLVGGLHALVRRGRLRRLAGLYPPNPDPGDSALRAALDDALREAEADLLPWLDNAPQTNEVARSAVLMPGLMTIAAETGLPLALFELGTSAGLNLMLDRYRYRLGGRDIGPADAPFTLEPPWQGPPPPDAAVRILRRRGVDRAPIDVTVPAEAERLVGYIWPDQDARLARTLAALRIAQAEPPPIDRADAAEWLEARLRPQPEPGVARVVLHSIALQYFPAETQRRVVAHLARVGAAATAEAPLAWLSFELDAEAKRRPALSLTLWPGGTARILALSDPHVRDVRWAGAAGARLID